MGLILEAKGFDEEIYHSGYMGFTWFRIELAKSYNQKFGVLYEKWVNSVFTHKFSDEDFKKMDNLSNKDLNLLLFHSDCDGKLTPLECKKIFNVTKTLKCDYPQSLYGNLTGKKQLDMLNKVLYHCWKRRVNLWFR